MSPAFEIVIRCPIGEIRSWIDAEGAVRTSVQAEFGADAGAGDAADTLATVLEQASEAAKALVLKRRSAVQRAPFADWLLERCTLEPNARELSGDLYRDYLAWCALKGSSPMSVTAFGNALRDRGVAQAGKSSEGQKYRGPIRLKRMPPGELPQLVSVRS